MYVQVAGRWCYLYRAIDRDGNLLDSVPSDTATSTPRDASSDGCSRSRRVKHQTRRGQPIVSLGDQRQICIDRSRSLVAAV